MFSVFFGLFFFISLIILAYWSPILSPMFIYLHVDFLFLSFPSRISKNRHSSPMSTFSATPTFVHTKPRGTHQDYDHQPIEKSRQKSL
jgi:hypothetical protein